jgi:integrase
MVEAMVPGGLRRCEVLGLRLDDLQVAARRVFIAEGKGGHQRLILVSGRFFASLASYVDAERPVDVGTDRVFVVLKGPRRGQPLSPAGLDQILASARERAGLAQATCHQLRHTCLTRLREAGMALEAVQAQAGPALPARGRRRSTRRCCPASQPDRQCRPLWAVHGERPAAFAGLAHPAGRRAGRDRDHAPLSGPTALPAACR